MPISKEEQAQLDARHDQMVEEGMRREAALDELARLGQEFDAACEWQCICCGARNDCED